jgi:TPR repeat protein
VFFAGHTYVASQTINWNTPIETLKAEAEKGNADAQCELGISGIRYNNGEGVTKDLKEAVKWYRKSAEQGNALTQFNLGICYYVGMGVTKDLEETVKWLRKAAEQGHESAKKLLAKLEK